MDVTRSAITQTYISTQYSSSFITTNLKAATASNIDGPRQIGIASSAKLPCVSSPKKDVTIPLSNGDEMMFLPIRPRARFGCRIVDVGPIRHRYSPGSRKGRLSIGKRDERESQDGQGGAVIPARRRPDRIGIISATSWRSDRTYGERTFPATPHSYSKRLHENDRALKGAIGEMRHSQDAFFDLSHF